MEQKMSLCGKLEANLEIKSSADRFHNVFSCRPHHVPIMSPAKVQGCNLHQGQWGKVGTVISWIYTQDGVALVSKQMIEAIDYDKLSITLKLIDGAMMGDFKNFKATIKATPKGEGGVVCWTLVYEKKHGGVSDPSSLINFLVALSKDIDAYLVKTKRQSQY